MSKPQISVVVPNYNYGRYLFDLVYSLNGGLTSLGSFSGQGLDIEIIIVDDHSTDNSLEILEQLRVKFDNIVVIESNINGGTAFANNLGIDKASSKCIATINADDMMDDGRLQMMYGLWKDYKHSVIYDDMRIFAFGKRLRKFNFKDYDFDVLIRTNIFGANIVFAKKAWEEVGGYPQIMGDGREDWAFNVGLGIKGYCGVHLAEPLYLYRREEQNRTLRNNTIEWKDKFERRMFALYPDIYSGERPMGCCGKRGSIVARSSVSKTVARAAEELVGSEGMVVLEYIGGNWGKQSYFGGVTGTRYKVGKSKPKILVDKRDADGLLHLRENKSPVFKLVTKPTVVKASKPKPSTPIPVEVSDEFAGMTPAEVEEKLYAELESNSTFPMQDVVEEVKAIADDPEIPLTAVSGIGETTEFKLNDFGIETIRELIEADVVELAKHLGWSQDRLAVVQARAQELLNVG